MKLRLSEIAAAVQGRLIGTDAEATGLSTDSRAIEPGQLFVALKGEQFDGHAYINQVVAAGAGAVIAQRFSEVVAPNVVAIEVDDSLKALGDLAGYRRRLLAPKVRVAALTGSSGKTSVKVFSYCLGRVSSGNIR